MLKAVMFDFDGVIADTEETKFAHVQQIVRKNGLDLPDDAYHQFIGKKRDYFLKEYFPSLSGDHVKKMKEDIIAYQNTHMTSFRLIPGLRELLQYLKEKKIILAITTGSKKDFVATVLEDAKIASYFDVIVTGEDVASSKPDPECYKVTLDKLKLLPQDVLIIEDSIAGVQAGKSLGIKVIGLTTTLSKEELHEADIVLNNHHEIRAYIESIV